MGFRLRTIYFASLVRSETTRRRRLHLSRSKQYNTPLQHRGSKRVHTKRRSTRSRRQKSSSILWHSVRETTGLDMEPPHRSAGRGHSGTRRRHLGRISQVPISPGYGSRLRPNISRISHDTMRSHIRNKELAGLVHAASRNTLTPHISRRLQRAFLCTRERDKTAASTHAATAEQTCIRDSRPMTQRRESPTATIPAQQLRRRHSHGSVARADQNSS